MTTTAPSELSVAERIREMATALARLDWIKREQRKVRFIGLQTIAAAFFLGVWAQREHAHWFAWWGALALLGIMMIVAGAWWLRQIEDWAVTRVRAEVDVARLCLQDDQEERDAEDH